MALKPSSQRQSITISIKMHPSVWKEVICISVEEIKQMLNESLQSFLDNFTEYSTAGVNLLQIREIISVLEKLGCTLEENLSPVERPGLSTFSLFEYLTITELLLSSHIIVLNLNEFNDFLTRVVSEQLGALKRLFRSITITAE